ncbi:MAG: hypothetical protein AAFM92_03235 [Pseudomonadota bacterium]
MRYVFFALLLAAPVSASDSDQAFSDAQKAAERCQSAWLQRSRLSALEDIDRAATELAQQIDRHSPELETAIKRLDLVTSWFTECSKAAYPESGS